MFDPKKDSAAIIDLAKLETLLKQRIQELQNLEPELTKAQQNLNFLSEQVIGLRHRINELTELLKPVDKV